jgi:hypothetical protein
MTYIARITDAEMTKGGLLIKKVFIFDKQGESEKFLKESVLNEKLIMAIKGGYITLDL